MGTRAREIVGIILIGDGFVGAAIPRRHVQRWLAGPAWWRDVMRPFADRPQLTRTLAIGELVAGAALVLRPTHRHGR